MDNLAGLIISPQYSCEVELHYCNREWYTLDSAEAYAERVLANKPVELQNNDFMNQLYQEIAADTNERETLSLIQFTDLHVDLEY